MNFNCINCKKSNQKIVTLVCDHQICLDCAENIKVPQGKPPLDAKFKIICPKCAKSTLTRNVQNLINQEQEKLLFENVESSQLNESSLGQNINNEAKKSGWSQRQLRQMSYSQRFSNIWAQRKTPDIADRVSKASNDSKKAISSSRSGIQSNLMAKCPSHQQPIAFLCENELKLMCMECMYKHTKQFKNHRVLGIKDALSIVANENKCFKIEAKKKIQQLDKMITICKINQGKIQQAYQINQQLVEKQFKDLQQLIKSKQTQVITNLEDIFQKKDNEIISQLNDLSYLKNILKQHFQFTLDTDNTQLYFFNAYSIVRQAISRASINIKSLDKQQLVCFDKFVSFQDFKILLDKNIRIKKDIKDSKAPSRGNSELGEKYHQKSKSILYQEYKNARKKLEKLDKMEKQHKPQKQKDKTTNYLNNFMIEIHKKQNQVHDKPLLIKQRKSSTSGYYSHQDKKNAPKALTPTRLISTKPKKK